MRKLAYVVFEGHICWHICSYSMVNKVAFFTCMHSNVMFTCGVDYLYSRTYMCNVTDTFAQQYMPIMSNICIKVFVVKCIVDYS